MSLDLTTLDSKQNCGECNTKLEIWEIMDNYEEYQLFCPKCEAGCGYISRIELEGLNFEELFWKSVG